MMSRTLLFGAIVASMISSIPANAAQGKKCVLKGVSLSCGPVKATRADLFKTFSKPETTRALKAMLDDVPLFENDRQREAYRRSLERIWRAVTRHGREEKRRYLRGDLTNETYRKIEADFAQARESYEAGINLYRYHIWMQEKPTKPSG